MYEKVTCELNYLGFKYRQTLRRTWFESLTDRRWSRRLIQLYKIRNSLKPEYLQFNPPPVRNRSRRNNNRTNYSGTPIIRTRRGHDKKFELWKVRIMEVNLRGIQPRRDNRNLFELQKVRIREVRIMGVRLYRYIHIIHYHQYSIFLNGRDIL